jgi:hypothetical protein
MTRRTQEAAMNALKTAISTVTVAAFSVGTVIATASMACSPLHVLAR